jgi:hypothetical protein
MPYCAKAFTAARPKPELRMSTVAPPEPKIQHVGSRGPSDDSHCSHSQNIMGAHVQGCTVVNSIVSYPSGRTDFQSNASAHPPHMTPRGLERKFGFEDLFRTSRLPLCLIVADCLGGRASVFYCSYTFLEWIHRLLPTLKPLPSP